MWPISYHTVAWKTIIANNIVTLLEKDFTLSDRFGVTVQRIWTQFRSRTRIGKKLCIPGTTDIAIQALRNWKPNYTKIKTNLEKERDIKVIYGRLVFTLFFRLLKTTILDLKYSKLSKAFLPNCQRNIFITGCNIWSLIRWIIIMLCCWDFSVLQSQSILVHVLVR